MSQPSRALRALMNMGFSDREASVYLALLGLGKGTVSEIARRAAINRTTGYDILDSLVGKGLATISGKEPKQEYAAESPEKIRRFLESQRDKAQEALAGAEEIIPELRSLYSVRSRPQIRFYEGKEGMKDVYEDTLSAGEAIRAYANVDDMHKALPDYFPRYYKRRSEKGIKVRAIVPANAAGIERAGHDTEESRETALVPADQYYFSPEINIYDNKVVIASWREKLGIIIESAEIADAMKKIYELAWTGAKNLDGSGLGA